MRIDGSAPAVLELQHLDEELGVDGAARAALEIALRGGFFEPHPHLANFGRQTAAATRGPNAASATDLHRVLGRPRRCRDDARFAERLPLPNLAAAFGEVAAEGVDRHGQAGRSCRWAQPGVDFVQPAVRAEVAGHADHALAKLAEEMAVGRAAASSPRCRPRRVAPGLVQEDQVEIAVVVWLAAAELAEGEHDRLADVAFAIGKSLPVLQRTDSFGGSSFAGDQDRRLAEFLDELLYTRWRQSA